MGATLSKKVNDAQIKEEVNSYPVIMYSKPHCGYCKMAKQIFRDEQIDYKEKDLELAKTLMATEGGNFQEYINGLIYITRITTVPQIFICGEFIGGYTELNKLREAKELWNKIQHCSDQYDRVTV